MSRKVATLLGIVLIGMAGFFLYMKQKMPSSDIGGPDQPNACFSDDVYASKVRAALQGSLISLKELLFHGDFSTGIMESDDVGPATVEDFADANKSIDFSKIQVEESHSYFKVNNWRDGQSLFLFPRRIDDCVYLTGAFVGSPDLALEQVESWQQQ